MLIVVVVAAAVARLAAENGFSACRKNFGRLANYLNSSLVSWQHDAILYNSCDIFKHEI